MQRKRRTWMIVLLVVAALALVAAFALRAKLKEMESNFSAITIEEIDLTSVPNGIYFGSYAVFPVSAEVGVSVESHRIVSIQLINHTHGQGKPAESIPERVVEAQSLQVDVISGATYSSKVILKAIEEALAGFQ